MEGLLEGVGVLEEGVREGLALVEIGFEGVLLLFGEAFEPFEQWEGEFAFGEVGAEGFADFFFFADEVEAVVVDLVGGTELESEVVHFLFLGFGAAREVGGEGGGGGEERAGFHFDDAEVFGFGE